MCIAWDPKCLTAGECTFTASDDGECALAVRRDHPVFSQMVELPSEREGERDTFVCMLETDGAQAVKFYGNVGRLETLCDSTEMAENHAKGMLFSVLPEDVPTLTCKTTDGIPVLQDDGSIRCMPVMPAPSSSS